MMFLNISLLLLALSSQANTELCCDDDDDDTVLPIASSSAEQLKDDLDTLRNMYMLPLGWEVISDAIGQVKINSEDLYTKSSKGFFSRMAKSKIEYH